MPQLYVQAMLILVHRSLMYFLCFQKLRKDEQGIAAHKSAQKRSDKLKALCIEEP